MKITPPLAVNILDLVSFILVTPDIVGVDRLRRGYGKVFSFFRWLYHDQGQPHFATPIAILSFTVMAVLIFAGFLLPSLLPPFVFYGWFIIVVATNFFAMMILIIDAMAKWLRLERIFLLLGAIMFVMSRLIAIQYEYALVN